MDLPAFTLEQRWDRASANLTLFAAMFLHEGLQAGKTPESAGQELATFFGPWSFVNSPGDMARAIYRNWQLWRTVEFAVEEGPDSSVSITTNRPYEARLSQYVNIGVTPAMFDAMFAAFHQALARQRGLDFQQSVDSTRVRMTIRRAP
jgi:hypothetical protein